MSCHSVCSNELASTASQLYVVLNVTLAYSFHSKAKYLIILCGKFVDRCALMINILLQKWNKPPKHFTGLHIGHLPETIQNIGADDETSMDQAMKEEDQHPIEKYDSLTDSTFGEAIVGDVDKVADIHWNENADRNKSVCPDCKFEFSTNANMKTHMKNVHHLELENHDHKYKRERKRSIGKSIF